MLKKQKNTEQNEVINYEKLRLDVLKGLIEDRNIECKQTKETMIKHLKMDDEGLYVRPTITEKQTNGKFIVKVDIRDSQSCREMGRLVEKGQAQRLNIYSNNRIYYLSNQKPI
jgi:hypothetical protein